jgi:hypothetical protein
LEPVGGLYVTPPQPARIPIIKTPVANSEITLRVRFFLPKTHNAPANDETGNDGSGFELEAVCFDWVVRENVAICCNEPDVAVTVTVDDVETG